MEQTETMQIRDYISELSSKSPVPGGGSASALIGAVGLSLCSMVANLTSGKKKYAEYQEAIERILVRAGLSIDRLLQLMEDDAAVFEPLSAAYAIPRDNPDRGAILEKALVLASGVPMDILREVAGTLDIVEELAVKGSRLAVSDVGVAAAACRCAMEGAAMNIYINTKLMNDRDFASKMNTEAEGLLADGVSRCDRIYQQISHELRTEHA
jgi:methenyltetrahydrofolate cyclohydrolase